MSTYKLEFGLRQGWHKELATMAAHRYWRIDLLATAGGEFALADVQFRTTSGTPLLFTGGVASATQTYNGSYLPAYAADNDPNTVWYSSNSTTGQSWSYDYGVDVSLDIKEVAITTTNDQYFNYAPSRFGLSWSDDGSTYSSAALFGANAWSQGSTQTFTISSAPPPYVPGSGRWSGSEKSTTIALSSDGQTATASGSALATVLWDTALTGLVYFEFDVSYASSGSSGYGVANARTALNGSVPGGNDDNGCTMLTQSGNVVSGAGVVSGPTSTTTSDIMRVCVDVPRALIWFGSWSKVQGNYAGFNSSYGHGQSDPPVGPGYAIAASGNLFPCATMAEPGDSITLLARPSQFYGPIPAGFTALMADAPSPVPANNGAYAFFMM